METLIDTGSRTVRPAELGGTAEIALAFGLNASTVATRISRARARGECPQPVAVLHRGAVYVIADFTALLARP
jgi:hypothetical protein